MADQIPIPARPRVGVADPEDIRRRASAAFGRPLRELSRLPGGLSSLTYRATDERGAAVVIKVAPPGLAPVRNRDVLRQARVLAALEKVPGVAVPAVLGTDAGTPPEIPPLFVMEFVPGESYEPRHVATGSRPSAEHVRGRGRAGVRMLAALHAVAPADLGLDEAPLTGETEVERWRAAFTSVDLAPELSERAGEVHRGLVAALPAPTGPAVLHGDWRLGNMQADEDTIRAVIDWEIWSVGDPRADLAWMRLMHDPAHPSAAAPEAPSLEPDEVLAEYEEAAGIPVAALPWFDAFVRYKQAAASALLVKNAERRGDVDEATERMRVGIGLLLDDAFRRLS
ncbi:phosphotransferase family protein [Cryptosporangium aurantiacum]|uniref:Predicted kinase, aminoglycoside phosphotransferase (APT) family n=1 Tax=Cryptosporangium aurantiacum TaxID=134849 RepID=A0A1M7PJM7_9ACTN|nr:phosphotransferase family protein [Cryptosporangium aurantiacum]SHN17299.1 Predicted kinase, aminoglycoside phosphotransferase (APT) family [Cryptosporangium aurantiacum]